MGVTKPDQFRPISLQSCPLKLIAKVLTTRLQPLVPQLVHPDQTGFIKGRSISENFIYAAEIVQTCYKRRIPTIALKLDFRKAFDSIEWSALDLVLDAKNFPSKWRDWIRNILTTVLDANGLTAKKVYDKAVRSLPTFLSWLPMFFSSFSPVLPPMVRSSTPLPQTLLAQYSSMRIIL